MSSQSIVLNLRYLASGGYGDVYVGNLSSNGMAVVVKFLREYKDQHARQVFAREIHILKRRLRGLVPLLSWNTGVEQPYYLMPYLAGGQLSRYAGRLTDDQLYQVAFELAHTIANFHAAVGTHGDFKPANILVSEDGKLNVADPAGNGFGCTILFSQGVRGTPAYWAPEVATKGISRAGDVYSYGATLYELLTGRTPQEGKRPEPTTEGYVAAPKIREVIDCCCQLDASGRPTMQDVVRILEGVSWAEILEERRRGESLLKLLGVVSSAALLVRAFSK
jgi:serine/threonine protein kinase